jgi:chromosome segregation ATPase
MTDDLVKRLRSQIGDDVQEVYLHEPLFALAADRIEALTTQLAEDADGRKQIDHRLEELVGQVDALTAERDNYKLCALHSRDVVEAAEAEIERLRDEIARLKSEDDYLQAFIEGQKAMPRGVFTIVDSPELATLQADLRWANYDD